MTNTKSHLTVLSIVLLPLKNIGANIILVTTISDSMGYLLIAQM